MLFQHCVRQDLSMECKMTGIFSRNNNISHVLLTWYIHACIPAKYTKRFTKAWRVLQRNLRVKASAPHPRLRRQCTKSSVKASIWTKYTYHLGPPKLSSPSFVFRDSIYHGIISVFLEGKLTLFSIPPLFAKSWKSTVCVFSPLLLTSKGGSFEPLEPPPSYGAEM